MLQTAETQSETSAAILSTTSNVITESSTFLETGETTTTVNWSVIVDPSPAAMAAFNIETTFVKGKVCMFTIS